MMSLNIVGLRQKKKQDRLNEHGILSTFVGD